MANAILMASGLGTRMRPLTIDTPKPLIKVGDTPLIETLINALEYKGMDRIFVVVGYLAEQFEYLKTKYSNLELLKNDYYSTINNISSIYVAKDILLKGACYVCEADLYVRDSNILQTNLEGSCYFGKWTGGYSDDWVFEQNEKGIITRIGKGGQDCFNMTGIAYFKEKDAKLLYSVIVNEYGKKGYESLFWDEVVNKYINQFALEIQPVGLDQIIEIDTVEELELVRRLYSR